MEIIRFGDLKPEVWRNGGGATREVAIHPKSASLQGSAWDWRVSIADVGKAGEFSPFPGMERLLTVIDGEVLLLTVDGVEQRLEKYRPFRFKGEASARSTLPMGRVRNLNAITSVGSYTASTSIVELSKRRARPLVEGQLGVLLEGQATATDADQSICLGQYDSVVATPCQSPEIWGSGILAVITIDRLKAELGADGATPP